MWDPLSPKPGLGPKWRAPDAGNLSSIPTDFHDFQGQGGALGGGKRQIPTFPAICPKSGAGGKFAPLPRRRMTAVSAIQSAEQRRKR